MCDLFFRHKIISISMQFRPIFPQEEAAQQMDRRRKDVLRLVEAMIQGALDLSPEEMVDAAFIIVNKIEDNL